MELTNLPMNYAALVARYALMRWNFMLVRWAFGWHDEDVLPIGRGVAEYVGFTCFGLGWRLVHVGFRIGVWR